MFLPVLHVHWKMTPPFSFKLNLDKKYILIVKIFAPGFKSKVWGKPFQVLLELTGWQLGINVDKLIDIQSKDQTYIKSNDLIPVSFGAV